MSELLRWLFAGLPVVMVGAGGVAIILLWMASWAASYRVGPLWERAAVLFLRATSLVALVIFAGFLVEEFAR